MLAISGLRKAYGPIQALDGLSLSIAKGACFGLLGPNGAGKSTLLHLLTGFLPADAGSLTWAGQPWNPADPSRRRHLGFVPQHLALYEEANAWENLAAFGRLYGVTGRDLRARSARLLERVGLAERASSPIKTYSGGMKRRLNLIVALLHEPELLLCDEPTVGVDPQSRNAIFELIEELHRAGLTIVYTSHYMEEVQRLCSRIAIIDGGRLLALGSLEELLRQLPYDEEVRLLPGAPLDSLRPLLASFGQLTPAPDGAHLLKLTSRVPLSSFFAAVEKAGLPYHCLRLSHPTLEALFLHLTGKSLRD